MRHIKLYEQYVESLNELSAKPYYWKWSTNKTATFDSIDDSFTVMFFPNNEDHTYMVHYESKRYGTNQSGPGSIGNAMRVLATVMDITIAFLDENPEYSAEFIGDKEEDEKEGPTKRDRIYKNMMNDLPDNYKWELGSDNKTIRISRTLVYENEYNHNECYENARKEFLKRRKAGENVEYYLGQIFSPKEHYKNQLSLQHAWVVKDGNEIIDPTPFKYGNGNYDELPSHSAKEEFPDAIYIGLPLPKDYEYQLETPLKLYPKVPNGFWDKVHKMEKDKIKELGL